MSERAVRERTVSERSAAFLARGFLPLAFASALGCAKPPTPNVRPAASALERTQMARDLDLLERPSLALASPASPEDAVVRITGPQMTCTGTLVASDLVLTAHHCLVARDAEGKFSTTLLNRADVFVELGGDYLPWGHVGLRAMVVPPCGESGGAGDVAVLVLERKLREVARLRPRLEAPPRRGEPTHAIGFGRCALSPGGIKRKSREAGAIGNLAQDVFQMSAAICPGDSGGPILSVDTHEIVGVISQSAMDFDERTQGLTVGARLDHFRHVFAYARAIANGADPSDLPPLSCGY